MFAIENDLLLIIIIKLKYTILRHFIKYLKTYFNKSIYIIITYVL